MEALNLPPAPRSLQEILKDISDILHRVNYGVTENSPEVELLREVLSWVSTSPNPAEWARINGMIQDQGKRNELVSVPVVLQRNQDARGAPMSLVQGNVCIVPLLLVMPLENLKISKLRVGMGEDPLLNMLPLLDARMVVPRSSLSATVLEKLEIPGGPSDN